MHICIYISTNSSNVFFDQTLANFSLPTGVKNFRQQIHCTVAHFLSERDKIWHRSRSAFIRHLFREFDERWSGSPATPCGDMHQSFTDALLTFITTNIYCNECIVMNVRTSACQISSCSVKRRTRKALQKFFTPLSILATQGDPWANV